MKTGQYIAFFILSAISAGCIIAALSTLFWVTTKQTQLGVTYESNWGMRQYQLRVGDGDRSTYDYDDNFSRQADYMKAGKALITMGSFALLSIAVGVVTAALMNLCQGWTGGRARFMGCLCAAVATGLIIAGTITYTQTIPSFNNDIDEKFNWSFYLFTIGGGFLNFCILVGLGCSKY